MSVWPLEQIIRCSKPLSFVHDDLSHQELQMLCNDGYCDVQCAMSH